MKTAQPMFDSTTHYRIEVRGRVDGEWLQSFADSLDCEIGHLEDNTVLDVHADQAGIIGLVRRLHGLGITIQRFQMIPREE